MLGLFLEWLHNWQLLKKGSAPWVSEWMSEWVSELVLIWRGTSVSKALRPILGPFCASDIVRALLILIEQDPSWLISSWYPLSLTMPSRNWAWTKYSVGEFLLLPSSLHMLLFERSITFRCRVIDKWSFSDPSRQSHATEKYDLLNLKCTYCNFKRALTPAKNSYQQSWW
jgi:hypothetical protein